MTTIVAEMQKDARKRLRYKMNELADAVANVLEAEDGAERHRAQVEVRRKEKSVGTYAAKVLCPHTFITAKRLMVMGEPKFSYSCNECKTHILSRIQL